MPSLNLFGRPTNPNEPPSYMTNSLDLDPREKIDSYHSVDADSVRVDELLAAIQSVKDQFPNATRIEVNNEYEGYSLELAVYRLETREEVNERVSNARQEIERWRTRRIEQDRAEYERLRALFEGENDEANT